MNFDENEIISAAMIGFDMIEGPVLKWTQTFVDHKINIDFETFMMNFYLSFRGGNDGLKPRAILYDDFYIVAYPRGLELCCLFMKPRGISGKLNHLGEIAEQIIDKMDQIEDEDGESGETDKDEVKRIIVNMLSGQEMSTPEIRRYFKMTNSEIWKIMSELEESEQVLRTQKMGRSQMWTSA
ncbi:MAG: hypothetical protein GF364_20485 [Candidatus Lokiarchaeota archaeon]|nr:hypothetical protein [Candidatus Lokiarchaeota archaeon]